MSVYNQPSFETKMKADKSPLTQADIESIYLSNSLERLYPSIPVLSEESTEFHDYDIRKDWNYFLSGSVGWNKIIHLQWRIYH